MDLLGWLREQLEMASRLLEHPTTGFTMDTHQHSLPKMREEAAERMATRPSRVAFVSQGPAREDGHLQ